MPGLLGIRTALRFRQKSPSEFFELQLEPLGRLHAACIPEEAFPPCGTCGRLDFPRPEEPVLDSARLPLDRDMFRVGNFATMIVGTERFREAALQLGLEGIRFRELALR
ncbi:double-CXXCG motif protein [Myxococcus sp. 1LA]